MEDRIKSSKVYHDAINPYLLYTRHELQDTVFFMVYSSKLSRMYTLHSMTPDQLLYMAILTSSDLSFASLSAYVLAESTDLKKVMEPSDFRIWLSMNFHFSQNDLDLTITRLEKLRNEVPEYIMSALKNIPSSDLPSYKSKINEEIDDEIVNLPNFKKVLKLFSLVFKDNLLESIKFSIEISKFSESFLFRSLSPYMTYFLIYFNALVQHNTVHLLQAVMILNKMDLLLPREDIFDPHDIASFILSHFDLRKLGIEKIFEYQEEQMSSENTRLPKFVWEVMIEISETLGISLPRVKQVEESGEVFVLPISKTVMTSKPSTSKSVKYAENPQVNRNRSRHPKTKSTPKRMRARSLGNSVTVSARETTEIRGRASCRTPDVSLSPKSTRSFLLTSEKCSGPSPQTVPVIAKPRGGSSSQTRTSHNQRDDEALLSQGVGVDAAFLDVGPKHSSSNPSPNHSTNLTSNSTSTENILEEVGGSDGSILEEPFEGPVKRLNAS